MHDHQTQPHYSPSSVGALMDPAFLRGVMLDTNGDHHAESPSRSTLLVRWRVALHTIAIALRRH
jgi:hypothetical protein